ncbi:MULTISPECIES: DUF305 domain-containing protein [unclassified Streptomyces]|uniref:DUF305 domain-containing protein n=1 Tax=unclassified Streptomyces TaxID=2593676 RepID=UPI002965EADE|nr:DUF305 domain-containing protein [Streptomyces sp. SJL17-1]
MTESVPLDPADISETTAGPRVRWHHVLLGAGLAVLLVGAVALGRTTASAEPRHAAPASDSADAGFARDMSIHHAQAVEMSFLVRSRSDVKDVGYLSYDIITTQSNQRGMMLGALQRWDLPVHTSAAPMAWMGHGQHSGHGGEVLMPGMASRAELDRLSKAPAKNAEVLYLQLMIRHHQAGVAMAQGYADLGADPLLVRLAEGMVAGQREEIDLMTDMLKRRGAAPLN